MLTKAEEQAFYIAMARSEAYRTVIENIPIGVRYYFIEACKAAYVSGAYDLAASLIAEVSASNENKS